MDEGMDEGMVLMDFSTLDLHGALSVSLMMGLALQTGSKPLWHKTP